MLIKFGYLRALTLKDAIQALEDHGAGARVLAGGTDLIVAMKWGLMRPACVVDVKHIPELRGIRMNKDGSLAIGACVTISELSSFAQMPSYCAALTEAASVLATHQVRNRATVGGNLCNASPACDLAPPLLVLGARLRLVSAAGERMMDLRDWFVCEKRTCIVKGEMLTEVVVSAGGALASAFAKHRRIRGHDLATVNAAAALVGPGGLRISLGAVAPRPVLVEIDRYSGKSGVEELGGILKLVEEAISPIDDIRASRAYRRLMAEHLVRGLLERLRGAPAERGAGKGGVG
jgi:xanthine dehydrogenase FAD-binding subunit